MNDKILSVAEVIAMEKRLEEQGTPLLELMRRAGSALAEAACAQGGQRIVVLAGSGNNGGDGWVAANLLAQSGKDVTLITRAEACDIKAEPARTAAMAATGFETVVNPAAREVQGIIADTDLVMDCILGTGFSHSQVREPYATWINAANEGTAPIISADTPSGLDAQTGKAAEPCVVATTTVTMLAVKEGLVVQEALPYVGKLVLAPLV